jgi:hypothetical protein
MLVAELPVPTNSNLINLTRKISMSIYSRIYYNLCSRGVNQKELWENKENNLHRHHILPKHSGGLDEECNFTYLTIREHIIAHFLLWKIKRNPNDLRSMHMLGARLTSSQRRTVGVWCKENNIGFWSPKYKDKRKEWGFNGAKTQIENKIGIHDPKNFKAHAILGGKASIKVNKVLIYWCSPEGLKRRAQIGGRATRGLKAMHIPGEKTFRRIKPEHIQSFLEKGYVFGSVIQRKKGRKTTS